MSVRLQPAASAAPVVAATPAPQPPSADTLRPTEPRRAPLRAAESPTADAAPPPPPPVTTLVRATPRDTPLGAEQPLGASRHGTRDELAGLDSSRHDTLPTAWAAVSSAGVLALAALCVVRKRRRRALQGHGATAGGLAPFAVSWRSAAV
jgi:hypothetical protein